MELCDSAWLSGKQTLKVFLVYLPASQHGLQA